MVARYDTWLKKGAIVAVLALALVAALLAIRPAGAQDEAPTIRDAQRVFDYAENGTGPITTYTARDPENKPVFWTLGGPDAADFTIEGGTLRFKAPPNPPNYEVPTDRARVAVTANPDASPPVLGVTAEDPKDNVYKVTVRFSAGGEDGMGGDANYDGDDLNEIELTVNVTNVNEPGSVVISPMQPQVGTALTAILTDEDNIAPGVGEWQWARSNSMAGAFTDIPELSQKMTYQPTIDDLDMYLRVTVIYVDRAGEDPRTVQEVSAYPVRKDTNTSNQDPKFPDQSTLDGQTSPGRENTDRFIPETATAGTNVGAPVTAFDDKTDIEVLTYSLRDPERDDSRPNRDDFDDDSNPDTPMESDGHAASFNIDAVTGQITVSAGATLDADAATPAPTNPYNVVVRAVDGDGDHQDIDVTIGVLQAAEPPVIDRTYATGRVPQEVEAGDRVPTEMTHYEADRTERSGTTIDTDLDTVPTIEPAAYYATDPDGDTIAWSLAGPDAGSFIFEPDARPAATDSEALDALMEAAGGMVTLAFRAGPDFETPGDANKDNVYEVTLVVTDSTDNTDELDVTVKVINSTDDNEAGTVSFLNRQPEIKTALTAMFEDKDTPIRELEWQWYRSVPAIASGVDECPSPAPTADDTPDTPASANHHRYFVEDDTIDDWVKIDGATSASYTPTEDDFDSDTDNRGHCLRAAVTYRDAIDRTHSSADDAATTVDETLEATWAATEQPVKVADEKNDAPEFQDAQGNATSTYMAEVAENGGSTVIGIGRTPNTLAATDLEGSEDDTANDLLTYTLSGRDAAAFTLVGTVENPTPGDSGDDGTLTFSGGADYETQRQYRVTITATDPSGDSDSVGVIVDVTNVNERPSFTMGEGRVVYAEDRTDDVGTYSAKDPEESGITYSLVMEEIDLIADDGSGEVAAVAEDAVADHALFEIGSISGKLSFKASPNYEKPGDNSDPKDNVYRVTVRATVSDNTNPAHFATQEVTVIVTDVNEPPVFSKTTDTLEISENPDNPEKEATAERGELYLLNRGVGIPGAGLPAAPNLDVGIPMVALDDDNTGPLIAFPAGADISETRQLVQGLTYELSGPDAGPFHIVPATGQILTLEKLDYETKQTYKVTVKATDPWGLSGSIPLTIEVTDVDETPLVNPGDTADDNQAPIFSSSSTMRSIAENTPSGRNIGDPVAATDADNDTLTYSLSGADMASFGIDDTTGQMMTKAALDYETRTSYSVTVTATDPDGLTDTITVTINVTNVDEVVTLQERYDTNPQNGKIDRDEVLNGIDDFYTPPIGSSITREQVLDLIDLFYEGLRS